MLSFLIPTYNYNCIGLVSSLFHQAKNLQLKYPDDFDFEIIVVDDASPEMEFVACYEKILEWEGCRFISLKENLGRAKVRNFLAAQAKFDYFVFIDCDAEVCTTDFVAAYWKNRDDADVVCGSLRNPAVCPEGGYLRYVYEKSAEEQRSVSFRNAHPYTYFTTFNVLFHRSVFDHLQFDERCTEYGYEDALMGAMLEKEEYRVAHIENPLVHNGIDPSAVYLTKIETSLRVLNRLGEPLHSASALIRLKRKLSSWGVLPAISLFYRCFYRLLRKNLLSRHPSMSFLKFYKLGYYVEYEKKHQSH